MPKMLTLINYQKLGKESDCVLIFKKTKYFKAEAAKINQPEINKRTK